MNAQVYIDTNIHKTIKHSRYEFNTPYNTMQTTRLLQLNNPPQTSYQHYNIEFYKNLIRSYLLCSSQHTPLPEKSKVTINK